MDYALYINRLGKIYLRAGDAVAFQDPSQSAPVCTVRAIETNGVVNRPVRAFSDFCFLPYSGKSDHEAERPEGRAIGEKSRGR